MPSNLIEEMNYMKGSFVKRGQCACFRFLPLLFLLLCLNSCVPIEFGQDIYFEIDDPSFALPGLYSASYIVNHNERTVEVTVDRLSDDKEMLLVVGVDEIADTVSTSSYKKVYDVAVGEHTINCECGYKDTDGNYSMKAESRSTITFHVFDDPVHIYTR